MRLREVENSPKVTQLVIHEDQGCSCLLCHCLKLSSGSNTFNFHMQCMFFLHWEEGKHLLEAFFFEGGGGRGKSRMGRAQSLFAIPAFTLFSSHAFLTPPSYCNSLLKYLRTVSCLQAPWSLQREELIEIQINKFHLKWEDAVLVYNA